MKYKRLIKYYLLRFFRSADSPSLAAGGFACGMVVHFIPTFGFALPIAFLLAKITRTSALASSIACTLTAPLFPIWFYLNVIIGKLVLGNSPSHNLTVNTYAILESLNSLSKNFFVGCFINSLLCLSLVWLLGYFFLKRYKNTILNFIKKT